MTEPAVSAAAAPATGSLFNRDFVLLWQGQLVSHLGNQAFLVGTAFWLMETTGSATLMGGLMMASTVPTVLLGPIGGTFADRHSRRAIILGSDAVRGAAVLTLALLLARSPGASATMIVALFVYAALAGAIDAAFRPAIAAAIPELVPRTSIAAANSLNQFSAQGSTLLGQAIGGVLYRLLGASRLLAIDGASFLLSAFAMLFVRMPRQPRAPTRGVRSALRSYRDETADGVRFVLRQSGMRNLLLVATGLNFFAAPIFVLLPFYVALTLRQQSDWYGFLLASLSIGSIAGLALATRTQRAGIPRSRMITFALVLAPLALGGLGLTREPAIAALLCTIAGVMSGLINVAVITLIQLGTPPAMRGRVMALMITLSAGAAPLGMAMGGVLGDLTGKNVPLIYIGSALLAALMASLAVASPSVRAFLADEWAHDR